MYLEKCLNVFFYYYYFFVFSKIFRDFRDGLMKENLFILYLVPLGPKGLFRNTLYISELQMFLFLIKYRVRWRLVIISGTACNESTSSTRFSIKEIIE